MAEKRKKTKTKKTKKKSMKTAAVKKTTHVSASPKTKTKKKTKPKLVSKPGEGKSGALVKVAKRKVSRSKKKPQALVPSISDSLSVYMADISKFPLLSKEEERKIAMELFENQDVKAAHILVTSNLRFVVKIAFEYSRYGMKIMDLVQEGNIGLMKAVKDFNPYKEVRLITYAVWWIRSYIQDFILKNWSLVKIGTTHEQKKLFYNLKREKERLIKEGQESSVKLLSENLGVREKTVVEMSQRLAQRDASLNVPIDQDSGGAERISILEDESISEVVDVLESQQIMEIFKDQIASFYNTLNEKEQYILDNRLLSEKPLTLQEIGNHFHITKERTRQLEERLKKKLLEYLKEKSPEIVPEELFKKKD